MVLRFVLVTSYVSTMLFQDGNIANTWTTGHAIAVILLDLVVSFLPAIGSLYKIIRPVAVVVIAFSVGNGVIDNYINYLLPMAIVISAFAVLIGYINLFLNIITKRFWRQIYGEITRIMKTFDFVRTSPGKIVAVPKVKQ